jgi:hypothetical protein
MFIDELPIRAQAGKGGDGSVHFARRKYQPFAGPDGGDGGPGGNVVLVGDRNCDALDHLRHLKIRAEDGKPGGGNLVTGATGADFELPVPFGTLAYRIPQQTEMGALLPGNARLTIARGGRGGKGNPHYATGSRRAPKLAEEGKPGEATEIQLTYRIYNDTALLEPVMEHESLLLPQLLGRGWGDVDWGLYRRKPRWVRVTAEYTRFDIAYLPADLDADGILHVPMLEHVYWALSVIVNLLPLEELAELAWPGLKQQLLLTPLRRCTAIIVLSSHALFDPWMLETEGTDDAQITNEVIDADEALSACLNHVTGGIVSG